MVVTFRYRFDLARVQEMRTAETPVKLGLRKVEILWYWSRYLSIVATGRYIPSRGICTAKDIIHRRTSFFWVFGFINWNVRRPGRSMRGELEIHDGIKNTLGHRGYFRAALRSAFPFFITCFNATRSKGSNNSNEHNNSSLTSITAPQLSNSPQ